MRLIPNEVSNSNHPQNRMIFFLKLIHSAVLILILIFITTGCGGLSQKEEQAYFEKAIPIGQEYFKKYYDVEVEFTEFYINIPMSSTMVLKGYLKDDRYTHVSLSFYFPSLEVTSASGPGDFIQKRKSLEEIKP
ncbi:hypothetical protein [Paenibacillus sp. QZ-Y1]|uniref:hypothetical protein n=1 Tax=Paenibacillus sp. QZ-Y1 TaxID=3414511 RepID=UPI003F78B196